MDKLEALKRKYEAEAAAIMQEQRNCNHHWLPVIFDPEIVNEPIYETRFQGSDCFPVMVSTRLVKHDRWSRECKKCGKVEYTKNVVATAFSPKF